MLKAMLEGLTNTLSRGERFFNGLSELVGSPEEVTREEFLKQSCNASIALLVANLFLHPTRAEASDLYDLDNLKDLQEAIAYDAQPFSGKKKKIEDSLKSWINKHKDYVVTLSANYHMNGDKEQSVKYTGIGDGDKSYGLAWENAVSAKKLYDTGILSDREWLQLIKKVVDM